MPEGRGVSSSQAASVGWDTVRTIRRQPKKAHVDIVVEIASNILHLEEQYGSFWFRAEGDAFFFDGVDRRVYQVGDRNPDWTSFIVKRYGLMPGDRFRRSTMAYLEAHVRQNAPVKEVRRYSFWERERNRLYISNYNGTAWQIDADGVKVVPNGTGCMFLDDDGGCPCDAVIGNHSKLRAALVDDLSFSPDGAAAPEEQADILWAWLLGLAFGDYFVVRPLLLLEGERGAGKTLAVQRIQTVLKGAPTTMLDGDWDQLPVHLLHAAPVALMDNMDAPLMWLRDRICAYITSGTWIRRKLYTDNERVEIRPKTFLAATSREPSFFRRSDVVDRCLVLRLDRRKVTRSPEDILEELRAERPILLGEWLWHVQRLVAGLTSGKKDSGERLAGFVRLFESTTRLDEERVGGVLEALQSEREELIAEEEPILDLLEAWLETPANRGREVTTSELYRDLQILADERNLLEGLSKHPRGFGRQIRNLWSVLERRFGATQRRAPGSASGRARLVRFTGRKTGEEEHVRMPEGEAEKG